jgi:hypothetical protein
VADADAYNIVLPDRMRRSADYDVWPEHHDVVMTFLRCQTQWRSAGHGVFGLDYGVVLQMLSLYPVDSPQLVMEDLQVIERRAVELLNERARKS